ncbi:class I SAM-dependent methyltransferase [Saccharopolyspora sp. ASAGF58]|uniref:class I SAM-dependent methyltransferase n=1 Tax=Saccharopolyspora sp. ASAGF58 TaxID=2719023 RepID=UPI001440263D|nr:class I SAM-dependent methyltransferase [Saccharopolyspora sp. ASAGF58]QIZ36096.1 class I SAM-dependent methyltransferase [Saccharopolyspora sp. ASAGF58]
MAGHSHDNIDWDEHLQRLRDGDELNAPEIAGLVAQLLRPADRTVIEVGAGAGGTAAAFAAALADSGGELTVVDTAPHLLAAAGDRVRRVSDRVAVHAVQADAAEDSLVEALERAGAPVQADLVFAAFVVHHLPDQLTGLRRLAKLVRPGGRLAVVEFGLETRVLPPDVGLGEPGLEARLIAGREDWFRQMRAEMTGSVRLPIGWGKALSEVGLAEVRSWSYLVDRPAPVSGAARQAVLRRLQFLRRDAENRVGAADLAALDQLLDESGEDYAGNRDDVYYLTANTVHLGTRP